VNYTVKAAARATGMSESRLRTWERRYGIPSPGRSATGRRRYNDDDLALIRRMAALVHVGCQPLTLRKRSVPASQYPERLPSP
jgi:MerR family transcriptional regulator, light-induced transcriptional regulator